MMRITPSGILLFLLQSRAAAAAAAGGSHAASPWEPHPVALPHHRDPSFVPIVLAFGCIVLFVGFFNIYLRHCSDTSIAGVGDPIRAFTICCSCGPHGIDTQLLDTFPILTYSTITHLEPRRNIPSECAVCLSEFNHHDSLRLLPKCNHVFHRECIDTWLAKHVTCPVCRAGLKWSEHGRRRDAGHEQVAIVVPNEEVNNAHQVFDESSVSRMDPSLRRCHTTGHSLGFDDERHTTLRFRDDVSHHQIRANHGRSALAGDGGGDGRSRERLGHSLTPSFVSQGNNASPSSSSSSSPQHIITLEEERRSSI